jgi:alpha-beta hydrolase superfamily lysophospholipase
MLHTDGTFQGRDGTTLYYQGWTGADPPRATLAVVHGFGEHSGRYTNVVDWFVPKNFAVYALDLRGHGRSLGQRGYIDSFGQFRDDVQAFLELVRSEVPQLPVFLVGHSLGGLIVLNYVLHQPVGLSGVVASGPLLSQPPISGFQLWLAKLLSVLLPRFTMSAGLEVEALSRDQSVVDAYTSDPLVHGKGTPRLAMELMAATEWTHAQAATLNLPCLIVHGGADRLCAPKASQAFFDQVVHAGKARIEYEGYFHEVFNELGKEKVLADVEAWMQGLL